MNKKYKKGFTLIDLLVSISIIVVLSSTIYLSINIANSRSREVVRRSDLVQLKNALETYFAEYNAYPSTGGAWWGVSVNGGSRTTSGPNAYIPGLTPDYITVLPTDPSGVTTGWSGYQYRSDGREFKLISHTIGPEKIPAAGEAFYDPARPTWAIMVCSAGAACNW